MGNSKNVPVLQKFFKKMFAGINTVVLDDTETVVTGMSSKEGEEVCTIHMCFGIPHGPLERKPAESP